MKTIYEYKRISPGISELNIMTFASYLKYLYTLFYSVLYSSQKYLELYTGHISYQLKEGCFRPSLIDIQHYRIQPNQSQSGKLLFGSHKHGSLYVI